MSNISREYNFKYIHYPTLVVLMFLASLFLTYLVMVRMVYPMLEGIQFIAATFGFLILLIAITLALMEKRGKAVLHKAHVEIELKDKKHAMYYREIRNITFLHEYTIHLKNGKNISIAPLPRFFLIFDQLWKFMRVLDKELKSNKGRKRHV